MLCIHFETLGCKLNQIETESMAAAFAAEGFVIDGAADGAEECSVEEGSRADMYRNGTVALCIVNTCTVTGKAEQKARRLIRLLQKKYQDSVILVTGCYAQVEPDTLASLGERVAVVPGGKRGVIAELPHYLVAECGVSPDFSAAGDVSAAVMSWQHISRTQSLLFNNPFTLSTDTFFFHSRASIKIQDGCNNACSYCRICIARGPSVSLDADTVINRIKDIEMKGWHEVVLTGVNLTHYKSGSLDFARLLRRILQETSHIRLRISSLYPERIDDDFLDIVQNPRVCPHFHLSIQSGSPAVLRSMRRCDSVERIYKAAEGLRRATDNPFLACDIITGFPGETERDFELTFSLCRDISFAGIHAFPFSPRPGTPAWSMTPRVPERIAGERVASLTSLAEENRRRYALSWCGRTLPAITEHCSAPGRLRGVTGNYLDVIADVPFGAAPLPSGSLVDVTVTGFRPGAAAAIGALPVTGVLSSGF